MSDPFNLLSFPLLGNVCLYIEWKELYRNVAYLSKYWKKLLYNNMPIFNKDTGEYELNNIEIIENRRILYTTKVKFESIDSPFYNDVVESFISFTSNTMLYHVTTLILTNLNLSSPLYIMKFINLHTLELRSCRIFNDLPITITNLTIDRPVEFFMFIKLNGKKFEPPAKLLSLKVVSCIDFLPILVFPKSLHSFSFDELDDQFYGVFSDLIGLRKFLDITLCEQENLKILNLTLNNFEFNHFKLPTKLLEFTCTSNKLCSFIYPQSLISLELYYLKIVNLNDFQNLINLNSLICKEIEDFVELNTMLPPNLTTLKLTIINSVHPFRLAESLVLPDNLKNLTLAPVYGIDDVVFPVSLTSLNIRAHLLDRLPIFPEKLRLLNISFDRRSSGPVLTAVPQTITDLNYAFSRVDSNFKFPPNLTSLQCSNSLQPEFSQTLKKLSCWDNNLTELTIPKNVENLWCRRNKISKLDLPHGLTELDCFDNCINYFDYFPTFLTYINASSNNLLGLPQLPIYLKVLNIEDCNVEVLPSLPCTLEILNINNNKISEFPNFPQSLIEIHFNNNPIKELSRLPILCEKIESSIRPTFALFLKLKRIPLSFEHWTYKSNNIEFNNFQICLINNFLHLFNQIYDRNFDFNVFDTLFDSLDSFSSNIDPSMLRSLKFEETLLTLIGLINSIVSKISTKLDLQVVYKKFAILLKLISELFNFIVLIPDPIKEDELDASNSKIADAF